MFMVMVADKMTQDVTVKKEKKSLMLPHFLLTKKYPVVSIERFRIACTANGNRGEIGVLFS